MKTTKLSKKQEVTGISLITLARKEKGNQKWIENAQLAIQKGEISLAKAIVAAQKELERVAKVRAELKKFAIQPASDYKVLKAMYETSLSLLTLQNLANDYALEAAKKAERFTDLTDRQREVISQYYDLKARREFAVVSQVRSFLVLVGEIKETKENKETKKEQLEEAAQVEA